jgi:hypothetical protein
MRQLPFANAPRQAFRLTDHAAVRLQQRGIPEWFLQLLLRHGRTLHDGHGAMVKIVCKATRRRLQQTLTRHEYARAERYFDVYAVFTPDQAVITAAHRTSRRFH